MLKEGETSLDAISKAKEKGVLVTGSTKFAPVLEKAHGLIRITFSLPEYILREVMERIEASLLEYLRSLRFPLSISCDSISRTRWC